MINTKLTGQELQAFQKPKMTTKQALSMQDTVNRALQARMPQQATQPMPQATTPNGFGRSV